MDKPSHIQTHNSLGLDGGHVLEGDMAEYENFAGRDDVDDKKEKENLVRKQILKAISFFYLFMQTSSIHGLNHLSTRRLHFVE